MHDFLSDLFPNLFNFGHFLTKNHHLGALGARLGARFSLVMPLGHHSVKKVQKSFRGTRGIIILNAPNMHFTLTPVSVSESDAPSAPEGQTLQHQRFE